LNSLRGLVLHGYTERRHGRSSEAVILFRQAAEVARALGERSIHVDALRGWANSEGDLGRLSSAADKYDEAVELLRRMDDPQRLAHTLRHRGDIALQQGDYELAGDRYGEALAIYRKHESTDRLDLGNALRGWAQLREVLHEPDAALVAWEEVLSLYLAVGVEAGIDDASENIRRLRADGAQKPPDA
jgi:tetratricopeptide (TPR) repeat protein